MVLLMVLPPPLVEEPHIVDVGQDGLNGKDENVANENTHEVIKNEGVISGNDNVE